MSSHFLLPIGTPRFIMISREIPCWFFQLAHGVFWGLVINLACEPVAQAQGTAQNFGGPYGVGIEPVISEDVFLSSGDLMQGNESQQLLDSLSSQTHPLTPEEYQALIEGESETTTPLPFNYRARTSEWSQVAAGQAGLGIFTFRDAGYLESDEKSGLNFGFGVHLLEGPVSPDLHSRLWDFTLGYQRRGTLRWGLEYDAAFNVGIFSDFEDSARDGIRFPSHVALSRAITPRLHWVVGADLLGRDDYDVLPIVGLRWQMTDQLLLQIEVPDPEFRYRYSETGLFYLRGELGGGTWDMEYVDGASDVMTYRQWALLAGLASHSGRRTSGLEIGYLIDRALEFRGSEKSLSLPDGWFFRLITRY